MMANVYSAIDSIKTSARMRANWMAGRAPGLRARPSQAAAVALDCAYPQPAEAIAIAKPEVMATQLVVEPAPPAGPWPNAGTANSRVAKPIRNSMILCFTSPPHGLSPERRRYNGIPTGGGFPQSLVQAGLTLTG